MCFFQSLVARVGFVVLLAIARVAFRCVLVFDKLTIRNIYSCVCALVRQNEVRIVLVLLLVAIAKTRQEGELRFLYTNELIEKKLRSQSTPKSSSVLVA